MNAIRTGTDVVQLSVTKEEARALGKTWLATESGGVSVLLPEGMARELRAALSSVLSDPKEAA